jgi:hypothetical protein
MHALKFLTSKVCTESILVNCCQNLRERERERERRSWQPLPSFQKERERTSSWDSTSAFQAVLFDFLDFFSLLLLLKKATKRNEWS